jgi:hypothetical protein
MAYVQVCTDIRYALIRANMFKKPTFHVGDKVYMVNSRGFREGPYLIASLPSTGKCTLSHEDGSVVRNGDEIAVDCIEVA